MSGEDPQRSSELPLFLSVAKTPLTLLRLSSVMQQPFALDFGYNAPQDEVSNYAQLYVASLIRDQTSGLVEPSFETLNAKGETVRVVKDTLAFCGNNVPQSTVFAMSILAFGSVSQTSAYDEDTTDMLRPSTASGTRQKAI